MGFSHAEDLKYSPTELRNKSRNCDPGFGAKLLPVGTVTEAYCCIVNWCVVRLSHRGSLIVIRIIPPAHENEEENEKKKRKRKKEKKRGGGGREEKQDCLFHWEHRCRCLFTSLSDRFECLHTVHADTSYNIMCTYYSFSVRSTHNILPSQNTRLIEREASKRCLSGTEMQDIKPML